MPTARHRPADDPASSDRQFATTLARGLEVLRCFTPQDTVLGNRELAERTGLSRPTISRFTYTLQRLGYLRVDRRSGKYQLGTAVLSLGYPLLVATPLRQFARPAMNALADAVRGTVAMGLRDRLDIVYVEASRSASTLPLQSTETGLSHPIVASAIGRAWLAACEPAQRDAVLNEVRVKTPALWKRHAGAVTRGLRQYARDGFCISDGDLRPEVLAVGVAFGPLADGELVVFNCTIQRHLIDRETLERQVAPQLVAMVSQLRRVARAL